MGDFATPPPGEIGDRRRSAPGRAHGRSVLRYFCDRSTSQATLGDLAAFVVERDEDLDRCRVEIRLHHVTLPKLDDVGVVEYDPRSHAVRYRDDSAEQWLDRAAELGGTPRNQA